MVVVVVDVVVVVVVVDAVVVVVVAGAVVDVVEADAVHAAAINDNAAAAITMRDMPAPPSDGLAGWQEHASSGVMTALTGSPCLCRKGFAVRISIRYSCIDSI
jgi:hypothetical protein